MTPPIGYAHTTDGADIAFWSLGDGPALVAMPGLPWSHIQMEWSIPTMRSWYEALGRGRRLVRYDGRGFGLSTRDIDELTLDTNVTDLAAVVDETGLERFDLYAGFHSGAPAVAYATRFPDRVGHLILFCAYASGAAHRANPLTQATRPIIAQDWEFYTQLVTRLLLGWSEPEAAEAFSTLVRECTTPEVAARALAATTEFDVTPLLTSVGCPALVLHRPEQRVSAMDNVRALAAGLPDARLSLQPGASIAPFLGNMRAIVREIDSFLGGTRPEEVEVDVEVPDALTGSAGSGISTVVFTDAVGSTELVETMGDDAARRALRALERDVERLAAARTGRVIKHLGDGSLLEFASTSGALAFATALQESRVGEGPLVRVGISAGEPIREDGDLHGSVVVLASRLVNSADPGEVLVSDVVRQLAHGKGFEFTDAGTLDLKGIDHPIQAWRLAP
jgi:class 3 adenylate cyclase